MQDFDTLRERVEATTEMLRSAQADRHDQTESLVTILRQLEEKHAAQAQQLLYYQKRVTPLEEANQQLASLMENLLDLIDTGFGDQSLAPLREASTMASAMLASDLFGSAVPMSADEEPEADEPAPVELAPEPEAELEIEDGDTGEEPAAVPEDTAELIAEGETDESDEAGVDLEMEEDALTNLDELLDLASEEDPEETVAFEEVGNELSGMTDDDGESSEPQMDAVAETLADAEAASDDIVDDGGFEAEFLVDDPAAPVAAYEDVSQATLELESEEDAAAGTDDLPDVVMDAMAAFEEDDAGDLVPEIPAMDDGTDMDAVATSDDIEAIAALAQQIEQETAGEDSPPPAKSDIRALLLRVEALAKKAEAMRLAQGGAKKAAESVARKADKPARQSGAAA